MWLVLVAMFLNFKYVVPVGVISPGNLIPELQIKTKSGLIQGSQETTIHGTTYFRYVGIPYAIPPVNNLRFRSPKPVSKWFDTLNATVAGPCCAGLNLTDISSFKITVSGEEDCLYLNVFTPKKPTTGFFEQRLSVMVYIFGGGFLTGCNNDYEPDFFIENNVILVVPNYRLAVLGYLSTEDMECPGNWAIKDIIASLKWIQTNIERFGGDPKSVTIFGQSAGAANINVVVMSSRAQGLFHKAILMSGSSLSFWAYQAEPKKIAFDVGIALGIETNSTKVLMQGLRTSDIRDLLKSQIPAILTNLMTVITEGLPFTPTIEPPHKAAALFTNYPYNLLETGEFNRVPIISGITTMEMLFFKPALDFLKRFLPFIDINPGLMIRMTKDVRNKTIVGNKIKDFYFLSKSYAGATEEELLKVLSEDAYVRPVVKMASFIGKYCPVYFYEFSYEGQLGLDYIGKLNGIHERTVKGVAHGEDIAYLFPFKKLLGNEDDMQMAKKLTKMYTNFAKSGNPTPNVDSLLDNVTWPTVSRDKFPYLNIGEHFNVINEDFDKENIQYWEELFKIYGQKPYKVY